MAFFWLLVIGVVGYFVLKAYLSQTVRPRTERLTRGSSDAPGGGLPAWLHERWAMAEVERLNKGGIFPAWYFDPMTEHQARRLAEEGRRYSASMTKGQASDLIGLGEPADPEDLEVLQFFKKPLRGMNEARARHEIAVLFQNEANRLAWEDRPATARQKEFFRFFGIKPGTGLLKRDADEQISQRLTIAKEAGETRVEQWGAYERILDDFNDPEFREGLDIKKPGTTSVYKAIESLLAEGIAWGDLDSDMVAERLIEIQPSIER